MMIFVCIFRFRFDDKINITFFGLQENEIGVGVGSANEVEERQVPTGSDPLHHKHVPFTSP